MWKIIALLAATINGEYLPVKDYVSQVSYETEAACMTNRFEDMHNLIVEQIMSDPAIDFLKNETLQLHFECKTEITNGKESHSQD